MQLTIDEATGLAHAVLVHTGYSSAAADTIAAHLIDSELRGYASAGLARILAVRERLHGRPTTKDANGSHPVIVEACKVTKDTAVLAHIDGQDAFGYLVGQRATELAIAKAKQHGIAIVTANNTWTTGMLSYYAEMAAAENLVALVTASSTPWVAAHGGTTGVHGTNPLCIGFPGAFAADAASRTTTPTPIIVDIATSQLLHADVVLAQRLGTPLPVGTAFDADGRPTTDPAAVFRGGAIAPWGGYKGSGLAAAVQLFGVLAGAPAFPPVLEQFGFTVIVIDPAQFQPLDEYRRQVAQYVQTVHASGPAEAGGQPLRLPFERSAAQRAEARKTGTLTVDDVVYKALQEVVGSGGTE
ncbi:hypothetical protein HMPREF1624_00129 [Sporothrix schenckii ATCC 58251]|uniref:Malate/L-lactate dehydrogenase n=1 Tax=Sporothrix schenckii (strain ATCC 58251 / de Perez 2211183) TaxID=1391915 RepID=U7Q480_SPOS1|nr:hypothetical protein HMPREF1624_00129 [Sporothrix schenckii ATCC 58251]